MTDHLTTEKRSWNMSRIRSKDTKPEKIVRSLLHQMGYRFRLHKKELPGKPDIYLKKYKTVIFCHGCFWHRHYKCSSATTPKTNTGYWLEKFNKNIKRDSDNMEMLSALGLKVFIIWECETKYIEGLTQKIEEFLNEQ